MSERKEKISFDRSRRNLVIALGLVGVGIFTGACKETDLIAAWETPSPTPVRPRPTDIPPAPTIEFKPTTVFQPTATPEPQPTATVEVQATETVVPEEKNFLIPGVIYPEEFASETIAGFLARGDNEYYRPVEEGPDKAAYIEKVYKFLLVNSENLDPLLAKTELSGGQSLAEVAAESKTSVAAVLEANKDLDYWREEVVGNLPSFAVFTGTETPLQLEVPWPVLPMGGEEFNLPPEKKEFWQEEVNVGETAKGNKINLVIFGQDKESSWKGRPFIWIIGGIHAGEETGDGKGTGWLALIKEYFEQNQEKWQDYRIAFLDPNFDGRGRVNPNSVNIQRNFGGPECPSCLFDEGEIQEGSLCSSSARPGLGPNSEPESQAIIEAAKYLQEQGDIYFCANLHTAGNSVESGVCMDNGLNCAVTKLIAQKMNVVYLLRWDRYACGYLHGEPDEYLRVVFGIPTATIEFSQVKALTSEADLFGQAIIEAVDEVYSPK